MKANRGLTIERMVELGRVSRSGFYRFDDDRRPDSDPDLDLRDAIQRIALEWPSYGRPRITKELRRRGWTVNPKRVYRLLREDNLLCVRKRKFIVTTDSNHGRMVYPNLVRGMVLTGLDQLWVADITYIRLLAEFVFLAVILDAYSRRVIGWALERTLEDELTLAALRMALARRVVQPGLIHPKNGSYVAASASRPGLPMTLPPRNSRNAALRISFHRSLCVNCSAIVLIRFKNPLTWVRIAAICEAFACVLVISTVV